MTGIQVHGAPVALRAGILGTGMIPVGTNSQLNPGATFLSGGGTSSRVKCVAIQDAGTLRLVIANMLNVGTSAPAEQNGLNPIKVRASIEVGNGKIARYRYQPTSGGTYAAGTTYALGDRRISAGILYVSLQASNTGHTPASSPTWWAPISTTAAALWNAATAYNPGDVVYRSDASQGYYIAIAASTNQQPPNATFWVVPSSVTTAYDATITYQPQDQVTSGGSSWVCLQTALNQAPAVGSAYWQQVQYFPVGWHHVDAQRDILLQPGKVSISDPVGISPGLAAGDVFYVNMVTQPQARTDTATVTSGSATVTDASITAADQGRLIQSGNGIPENTYVGTVTAGVSFLLSSSPYTQVNVNATASAVTVQILGVPNQGSYPRGNVIQWAAGDFEQHSSAGTAPEDYTLAGPTTRVSGADGTTTSSALVVLGAPRTGITSRKVIAVAGDSIANGTGDDTLTWGDEALGYILRALTDNPASPTVPVYTWLRMARGSSLGQYQYGVGAQTMLALAAGCTHVIDQWAVNDLGSSRTLAQIQADATARWTAWKKLGLTVIACTSTPKSTSTDSWATVANQTPVASFGAASKWSQYNAWLLTLPSPLGAVFDAAAVVANTGAGGGNAAGTVWQPGMVWLTDGLGTHPSQAGHIALATALNALLPNLIGAA